MKTIFTIVLSLLITFVSAHVSAHSRYVLPSHTLVSGDQATPVALDLVVSNDFFHPDKAYGGRTAKQLLEGVALLKPETIKNPMKRLLASTKLTRFSPSGKVDSSADIVNFGVKSVAGAMLDEDGSYRFSVTTEPLIFTVFKKADGSRSRTLGKEGISKVPADATDVITLLSQHRAETYISRNGKTDRVLSNTGLELSNAGTHPNDLFANESVRLQFLIDGKPLAKGVKIDIVREGTRHRNNRDVLSVETDENGFIEFDLDKAGFYFLDIDYQTPVKGEVYSVINHGFSVVLEVFPE